MNMKKTVDGLTATVFVIKRVISFFLEAKGRLYRRMEREYRLS